MSKSIVIFYSWAGHTRRMAEAIAAETGADLLEIPPREAYPASYRETLRRSKAELDTGRLPDIQPAGQDLKGYDTVYIGSPVWYGTIAPPLTVYLKSQQLAGKRVLPFCTHGGGGKGHTDRDIAALCAGAQMAPMYAAYEGGTGAELSAWVRSNA